ncbi:hypothetical protein B0J17DRAFT_639950 [Rhizoctonia solani]|nr:hypothetical protein B0J17DRAFT_639950 [Rhizoctonia solani]
MISICRMKQLAVALRSARVVTANRPEDESNIVQLLRVLVDFGSSLSYLCIKCIKLPTRWHLSPQIVKLLARLRLTHLSLPRPRLRGDSDWNGILNAVPALESLTFTWGGALKLVELVPFAKLLPHLSCFSCDISFTSIRELQEQTIVTPNPPSLKPLRLEIFIQERSLYELPNARARAIAADTEKIARYLHMLWPNIECKTITYEGNYEDPPELIQLNKTLCQLRGQS